MLLNDNVCITELFSLLGKTPAIMYDDNDLNEAMDYAGCVDCSLLEKIEQEISQQSR